MIITKIVVQNKDFNYVLVYNVRLKFYYKSFFQNLIPIFFGNGTTLAPSKNYKIILILDPQ